MQKYPDQYLTEGDEKFRQMVEEAKDYALFMLDADGRVHNWNAGAERLNGYRADEILGQHVSCFHTPEDVARRWPEQQLRQAEAHGWSEDEGWRVRKDGFLFWADVMTTALHDAEGNPRGFSIVTHDITRHKQTQAALAKSDERLWVFIDHAPAALAMFDREMRYLSASRRWISDYGLAERKLLGQSHLDMFPDISERWREVYRRGLAGEVSRAEADRFDRADGLAQWIRWEVQPWRDPAGNIGGIVIFSEDVSDIKLREEALRVSEERLAAIIGSAMDAIITVDENQRVVIFNAAAEKIFRTLASEIIGQPLDRFLPDRFREYHRRQVKAFGATGVTTRSMHSPATIYGLRADGEEFPCEATISQLSSRGQKLYTVILRDISARKKAEKLADLYAKNKLLDEVKTKFFSNIHHELRTPLTLILGPIQKRLSTGGLTQELRRDLELVERNARLLQRHVNDLLDLSKLDAGKMALEYASVDLALLVRVMASHFELSAIEHGIRYTMDIPDSLPAQIDAPKIERVIVNLLSNAFKFTAAGGSVRIALRQSGDGAILEVEDDGPGVPAQLRETIFQRFWQAEAESGQRAQRGTGLGLSIVKEFVSLHRGSVTVADARGGKGTVFAVALPLSAPQGTELLKAVEEPNVESAREAVEELEIRKLAQNAAVRTRAPGVPIVLIVEDNADMNAFIATTLSERFQVVSAFDAQEGLEQALRLHPDLIFSDILMPGMTGDQLVKEFRNHPQLNDVPIVLLSVVTDAKLKVQLLQEGAQDFLHKPFRPDELLAKAERIIADRRRAAEELRDMRQLSGRLLSVREQERKEVAEELHENVAQYLAALGMYLASARSLGAAPSPEVQQFLDQGYTLLREYSSDIQARASVLYPAVLDNLGVVAALRQHIELVKERSGVDVSLVSSPGLGRLPAEHELALYRIAEEALSNVCRHSGCKTAAVRVTHEGSEITLEVADAGCGMNLSEERATGHGPKGTGILEMGERMRNIGGQLEISSTADGTSVRAKLAFVPRPPNTP
jgi:PAS domain S-box-containing protein